MIEFRQKDFSVFSRIASGASTGAGVGSLVAMFRNRQGREGAVYTGAGLLIGASLGAFLAVVDKQRERFNRKTTVDNRLMKVVVENLKKDNFQEDKDFTRDPKRASELKTRVAIQISRVSGDLRVGINMISDPRLQGLAKDLVKNIPNKSAVSERNSDRFNDIIITTISDSSMDAGLVTGVAERFIHSGYPVQLVEVG